MPTQTKRSNSERWTFEDANDLYAVKHWGKDIFDISEKGEVRALLHDGEERVPVSLHEITSNLRERGLDLPVLLRFPDFLEMRIAEICQAFNKAMKEVSYNGVHRGVYPIKVNQQQQVVADVAEYGKRFHYGLEAGSKAELVAALAHMHDPEAYIICNGYKDQEFIDLALYALKLGLQCILVVEMPAELDLILQRASTLDIRPMIGLRAKLSTKASGHWVDSGGDRSVFGLGVMQLVDAVEKLRSADRLDCLRVLHFHQGSQISNIRHIREAVSEAARLYANLVKEGAAMGILDIGGGLAVDYDGSQTDFQGSRNYTLAEYAADVVETVMAVCNEENIAHPSLVTESGRATVAYCSVLLFNVFEVTKFEPREAPADLPEGAPDTLKNMLAIFNYITPKKLQEAYNDAVYYREELRSLFKFGNISLRDLARGEHIYWNIVAAVTKEAKRMKRFVPPDLQDIETNLVDIYHVNFSVFQSLPDAWAIEQLFPVMPIHRLDERPGEQGIMADITCDCDGKIDSFIDLHGVRKTLPLHQLRENEPYILGVFLVGAYQETLGDLHNLLGDTHVVSIRMEEGELNFEREVPGDTIADVLSYVEYDPKELLQNFRRLAERAVRRKLVSVPERRSILDAYDQALRGYTYFQA